MQLILHIIWKDIRSEKWALLLWAALYLAQIALGLVVFHHDYGERDFVDAAWIGNGILVSAQFVTAYILVVRWVQADAVTGTRMFWLTRPISTVRLVRAKGWGLFLVFGLLPVLLKAPWWLYCGFTAGDIGWAALETVGWQLLLIAPALLIASLTDDFGRALMWGLLLVLFLFGVTIFLYSQTFHAVMQADKSVFSGGLLFTRFWLSGFLLVAGSILVASYQFRTRRTVRSLALAGPMVMLALVAGRFWSLDCRDLFKLSDEPEPARDSSAYPNLQLAMGDIEVNGATRYTGEKEGRVWIQQTMQASGVPAGWSLWGVTLKQSWSWLEDSASIVSKKIYFADWSYGELRNTLRLPAWQGDPETAAWEDALNAKRKARGEPVTEWASRLWQPQTPSSDGRVTLIGRTSLRDSEIARLRSHGPVGVAQVELNLGRPKILLELPLKRGASWSGASRAFRVGPWGAREEYRADALLMIARPSVLENGLWSVDVTNRPDSWRYSREWNFLTVNRSNNTIGSANQSGDMSKSGRLIIAGVQLQWSSLNISSAKFVRGSKWVAADPDWPEHTSLVMIDPGEQIRLKRELRTEPSELPWMEIEKVQTELEKKKAESRF